MNLTTTIRRVCYDEILGAPNAQQLIDEYDAECSIPLIGKINPQAGMYAALEAAGVMHFFGVYAGDDLVGFASVVMSIQPHYGLKLATVGDLFVASSHRSGRTGRSLMDMIEAHARLHECVAILIIAPVDSQLAMVLLASKPYECTNVVFCRNLA